MGFGLEIDWVPGRMDKAFANAGRFDFDYVIGSIHYIDELPFDNPDNQIAVEINTAGLRKPVKEMYPTLQILKKAARQGLMLTFGSDAHAPTEIAASFADAVQLAKEAGFEYYHSFDKRKPTARKLI